ncbi:MAG: HDIG domain-containing protein [Ignavibacteria bacterium]|nr:HDIG domain-containing protein [Ignavibacteria bacterium]
MTDANPTREDALRLLHEYTKGDGLRKHALAVEAAMIACAEKFGGDPVVWGITGLLHDFDYERFPEFPAHPTEGNRILKEHRYPEEIRTAILGHVPEMNVPRESTMARALFACDELSGLVMACALVRPNGLADLRSSSVRKKMKDKAFARGVSREHIVQGAQEAGIDLNDLIDLVIQALRDRSSDLLPDSRGE